MAHTSSEPRLGCAPEAGAILPVGKTSGRERGSLLGPALGNWELLAPQGLTGPWGNSHAWNAPGPSHSPTEFLPPDSCAAVTSGQAVTPVTEHLGMTPGLQLEDVWGRGGGGPALREVHLTKETSTCANNRTSSREGHLRAADAMTAWERAGSCSLIPCGINPLGTCQKCRISVPSILWVIWDRLAWWGLWDGESPVGESSGHRTRVASRTCESVPDVLHIPLLKAGKTPGRHPPLDAAACAHHCAS